MSSFQAVLRPSLPQRVRTAWFSNPRADLLSGLVVALALIPEALSFSVIAGVDPKVGLYASFTIAIIIAFAGGRPAMISAATGAMALVLVGLVRDHGVEYMFAATVLTGVFQILFGLLGVHRLMRFVPRTVMVGFVNALAILLFAAQVPHITSGGWPVIALAVLGLGIIYLLPRLTKAVPAPLVAIVVVTALTVFLHISVPTVGDQGELPSALPGFGLPMVPFTLETFGIIAPYALTLAAVGLIESLLTAQLLDDITDTGSSKGTEVRGQGIANIATGFLGGMAGCAMIGQSMINVKSGGRTRLSTLAAGVFLLVLVFVLGPVVSLIPMAALVAVMVFVSVSTFDWTSIRISSLRRTPKSETAVMVVTVGTVVATHNLALGVLAGALLSAIFFARRVAHLVEVSSVLDPDGGIRVYAVTGELFFASTNELMHAFDYTDTVSKVVVDLSRAHVWDSSAVATLDAVTAKFAARGVEAEIIGLNPRSEQLHATLSGQLTGSH
ncbi:SulP family inorganic anion transporter [Lentzea flaviverrucosa]|uniref:Sulfate permease, SulP family n=1 Tax=Lentzea flaviverrucosa TaxID=200379 RepID=A0A1H9A0I3_9PSEU|nr:SulP family inorganic anion transporter [Lentzea flaviverrucosa]RDI32202.1 SulP family sulfate permease [Lentzea flaviverrucosa]SEP70017.1 sulfate permease, SulP family [Lentzea flaviverrucosa]